MMLLALELGCHNNEKILNLSILSIQNFQNNGKAFH